VCQVESFSYISLGGGVSTTTPQIAEGRTVHMSGRVFFLYQLGGAGGKGEDSFNENKKRGLLSYSC